MPILSNFASQPSMPLRAAIWISLGLFFFFGMVGSPFAQSGPGGYGPGGGGFRSHGGNHFGAGGRGDMPSAASIEGPPSPAIMHDSLGVNGDQLEHYSRLYTNHMADTKPLRDSLRTSMQAARTAFENGDRSEAQNRHETVQQQWKELSQSDKNFDQAVKDVLTKDQMKRYDQWKENRDQAARNRWHHDRQPSGGPGATQSSDADPPGRGNL